MKPQVRQGFEWLQNPFLCRIVDVLGFDNIRFVGGAVRDSLIRRAIHDIDAATTLKPEAVVERLTDAGISVIPTGLSHGTVTAHSKELDIEITTLRIDTETNGRHAKVTYTDDWALDAARRDFTFNAIYVDAVGELFDPCGGQKDIETGHVRFIGNPIARIEEDALRVLRFFRFFAWYGSGNIDREGLNACHEQRGLIANLSIERVRDELLKLLSAPDPYPVIQVMNDANILPHILPNHADISNSRIAERFQNLITVERLFDLGVTSLARLMCFYGPEYDDYDQVGRKFRLSRQQTKSMIIAHDAYDYFVENMYTAADLGLLYKSGIYRYGLDAFLITLRFLPDLCDNHIDNRVLFDTLRSWQPPTLSITGHDLLENGWEPGKEISRALKTAEDIWIDSDFTAPKAELLSHLIQSKLKY